MTFMRSSCELSRTFLLLTISFASANAAETAQSGIPISDPLTISKCGGCHQRDEKGLMRRLSYIRTTPEVWQQAIKRMIRLNGLQATPAEIRGIVRYLSNNNGLAPEEMKAGFWEVEHRIDGFHGARVPDQAVEKTCTMCHNIGRVLAQRRTREDYEKLIAMHIGLFPGSENTFRPARPQAVPVSQAPARLTTGTGQPGIDPPKATPPPAPDAKYPSEIAVDYLASKQPLITPEWTAWRASMRTPKLAGTWLLAGYHPGKGKVFGEVTITPGAEEDQFTTSIQMTYPSSGTTVKLTGPGIVYTGYSWRGRATSGPTSGSPSTGAAPTEVRQAMMVSRNASSIEGRWFWGAFGEFGIDVHLVRRGAEAVVLGSDVSALQSPSKREVKIYGGNFPSALKPADIDLGKGISVTRILNSSPSLVTVEVDVAKDQPTGVRDISIRQSNAVSAIAIYDKISYIQITPNAGMARLGGVRYPKQFAGFDAMSFANGPDGKAHTADDVALGPVPAKWALEEFHTTPDDDDTKYVGTIDDSGLFTPNAEGPNPERKKQANNFGTNNFGDVWVTASYKAQDGTMLEARSYLVVTVPLYTIYDQPEVGQ